MFERNVIVGNTNGAPIWFDSGAQDARISRNVFLVPETMTSSAVVFELTGGPVLFDNNIVLGGGVASQDAANITLAHNLVAGFKNSAAVTLGGLTGRTVSGRTASLRSWWVGANVLLAHEADPWITMHKEKHAGNYELVYNETAEHNVVSGGTGHFPLNSSLKVDVSSNYNATNGSFIVKVDYELMVVTLHRSPVVRSGCAPLGPGGDVDFRGRARSPSQCVAGVLSTLPTASASTTNISLWSALVDGNDE